MRLKGILTTEGTASTENGKIHFLAFLRVLRVLRGSLPYVMLLFSVLANAQVPRINTFYPIGGQAGTTIEVELRGSSLSGAEKLLVSGPGITGVVKAGSAKADDKYRPLFQAKCGGCHELRSPANRSLTAAQWAATVDRMVKVRNAPLSATEQTQVTEYLQSAARTGRVTAELTMAAGAPPGIREIRIVTPRGVSTAGLFEVGKLPEILGANGKMEQALAVKLPCVANGCFSGNAERHFYRFGAEKGQRYVFDMKAFRYSEASQMYFNPNLRLYDSGGQEIAENHGYYDLDPLLDWTCPSSGDYTLEARDLLGRGNPGSVYRLTMVPVSMGAVLEPPTSLNGARAATAIQCVARPDNVTVRPGMSTVVEVTVTRRDRIEGDITVQAEGLPQGVSAAPVLLPPDRQVARLILRAEANAASAETPIRLMASGKGTEGEVRVRAVPQETYLINNQARYIDRTETVLAIRGTPDFEAMALMEGALKVHPRQGTPVRVSIKRREGFTGPVTVRISGLPPGWVASPETIQPNRTEVTLTVRPDGNNPAGFLNRDPKLVPYQAVIEAVAEEFPFVITVRPVQKADNIKDEKDDRPYSNR